MPAIRELYGLLGDPVAHSLSPDIHAAAFAQLGRPAAYVAFRVPAGELERAFEAARVLGLRGFNVTIPHKEGAAQLCDELQGDAVAVGAVNVVVQRDGRLVGHNTDTVAVTAALSRLEQDVSGRKALVLGAGGAARAAAYALGRAGAEVIVANRTFARAQAMSDALAERGLEAVAAPLTETSLRELLPLAQVVVNATSVGLEAPAASALPEGLTFDPSAVAIDLVYRPLKTRFLQQAREQELRTVDGLEILIHQAVASLSLWLGRPVDAARLAPVMRAAALEALL